MSSRLAVLLWLVLFAGCERGSRAPEPSPRTTNDVTVANGGVDASSSKTATPSASANANDWPLAPTYPLTSAHVEAVQLATDGRAIYGISRTHALWALDAAGEPPRQLVAGDGMNDPFTVLVSAGDELFWTDMLAGALHRTHKDGSGDVVLATIGSGPPPALTADETRVWWTEFSYGQGGVIRSLPIKAAPGQTPVTSNNGGSLAAISSMVSLGGALYWTPFAFGATVYYAGLETEATGSLLAGAVGASITVSGAPYGLVASEGQVYFGYYQNLWTTAVARVSNPNNGIATLSLLPTNVTMVGATTSNGWLLVTGRANSHLDLYATTTQTPAGLVIVSEGLQTPVIAGPNGVTFIDGSGTLVAIRTSDLSYVGYGKPPP